MRSPARQLPAAALTALASVAVLVALLAHYANRVLVDPSSFSDRAVRVVRTGAVDRLVVDQVTGRLLAGIGNEASVRPQVEQAVRTAVSSPQITREIRSAARLLQSELVSGEATALTLTLPDVGSAIAPSIEPLSPQLAAEVTRIGTITVFDVPIPSSAANAVHALATLGQDFTLLVVITIALILAALVISPERRRTLVALGLGAVASGVLAAAIYFVGRGIVVSEFSSPAARTAARAAWSTYLGGLETSGFVVAGVGALIACAAALLRAAAGPRRTRGAYLR